MLNLLHEVRQTPSEEFLNSIISLCVIIYMKEAIIHYRRINTHFIEMINLLL